MKQFIAVAAAWTTALLSSSALPCGGGFGQGYTISPQQQIVLSHKDGVETYFFSPHFCGRSASFGLILPVPAPLNSDPAIGDPALVTELEDLSQPTVEIEKMCRGSAIGCGGDDAAFTGGAFEKGGESDGVDVIDSGKVGLFDWSLLKADDAKSFTDWLDANHYPYSASSVDDFLYYVQSGWYFVAFKVTAGPTDPPQGKRLCGDLGPIVLSFPTAEPVVPARIAAASSQGDAGYASTYDYTRFVWRIFAFGSSQFYVTSGESTQLRFSGEITTQHLAKYPALGAMSAAGDRLTTVDVTFQAASLATDLVFRTVTPYDYRFTEYRAEYLECGGCSYRGGRAKAWFAAAGVLVIVLVLRMLGRKRHARATP
jgi:hypothetical protein